jgi:pimeloyl-ACP methyl ester carboxylesterase
LRDEKAAVITMRSSKLKIFAAVTLFLSIWVLAVSMTITAQEGPESELTVIDTMITVDGVALNFQVLEGGNQTILLEAGGGMDLTEWKDIAPGLARETGATVVSYSRPGFGKSDLPEEPCDMKVEAGWLWNALGQLGLDSDIILVGHSYGGWMVRLEASMYPADVLGIVFVDPFSAEFVDILGVEYLDNHPLLGKLPFDTSDLSKLSKYQLAEVRMTSGGLGPKMKIMKETVVPEGIPVVIIRSGLQTLPDEKDQDAWDTALTRMAASIDGAILITAWESNHMIPWNQPGIVVDAVKETLSKVD